MDTIVAPASALVTQAVGIVRLSGPKSYEIARLVLSFPTLPEPGKFSLKKIIDPKTKEIIDEGLVLTFISPHSFTGEDSVEFQLHGSPAVLKKLTQVLIDLGARQAKPGEFSFRAFLNGTASLSELETFNALTNSSELGRGIGQSLNSLRESLMKIIAEVEASISFPTDADTNENILKSKISDLLNFVCLLCDRSTKPGLPKIVIAGPQNAGKSTLFNKLVGFDRTVVSNVPGTTRDYVCAQAEILGKCVEIYDSPGFEDNSDDAGQLLAKKLMESSDVVIWMESEPNPSDSSVNTIKVHSRFDESNSTSKWLCLSAKTGQGYDDLLNEIVSKLPKHEYLVSPRQKDTLHMLKKGLQQALDAPSVDVLAFELSDCARLISQLDGSGLSQETLSLVFSTFCIGK